MIPPKEKKTRLLLNVLPSPRDIIHMSIDHPAINFYSETASALGNRSTNGKRRALILTQDHIPQELIKVWPLKRKKKKNITVTENSCSAFCGPTAPSDVLFFFFVKSARCSHYSALFLACLRGASIRIRQASATDEHPSPHRSAPWCEPACDASDAPKKSLSVFGPVGFRCGCSYTR